MLTKSAMSKFHKVVHQLLLLVSLAQASPCNLSAHSDHAIVCSSKHNMLLLSVCVTSVDS
jgi:hypothetical protein